MSQALSDLLSRQARPELMTYTDAGLQQRRDEHLGLRGGLRPASDASPHESIAPAKPALGRRSPPASPLHARQSQIRRLERAAEPPRFAVSYKLTQFAADWEHAWQLHSVLGGHALVANLRQCPAILAEQSHRHKTAGHDVARPFAELLEQPR